MKTGIYNNRNVAGTAKKSSHAEGRGLDIHLSACRSEQHMPADQLFFVFIRKASQLVIDHVIWNKQLWSLAQQVQRNIELEIAIIRTGIEDLGKAFANMI